MKSNPKPKVAFFDFAGCEGCQLTALDSLQTHPELLDAVEIVQFREAMSEKGDDYQVAFVEGGFTRPQDESRLEEIRQRAQLVIAFGACAHLGGVNALRNWQPLDEVRRYVYGEMGRFQHSDAARPISEAIEIDGFIPGCPIDPREFIRVVTALLQGRKPTIPDYPVCVECKLNELACLFKQGKFCLGPVTRAGCSSVCPSYGLGCLGCRGQVSNPNFQALKMAMVEHCIAMEQLDDRLRLFQSFQLAESEV